MTYIAASRNAAAEDQVFGSSEGVVIDTAQYYERIVAVVESKTLAQTIATALNGA